ncbi:MAG: phosphotransferase [Porticoccaceae bacterium]|nr:phosphotransferase [Pseudomonadales bacterium]MCP5172373.1 phosphotransferase [Pseudomonadales bacterium]
MNITPRSPEEFSNQWFEHCLKAPPGSLENWSAQAIGDGHIAGSYRVLLKWKHDGQPLSVVVKCPHPGDQNRQIAKELWLYRREVAWYQVFAEQSRVRCPKCYFVSINAAGDEFALILEDCAPAKQGDQLSGATTNIVAKALREMALLHTPFFLNPSALNNECLQYDFKHRKEKVAQFDWAWPLFKERYRGRFDQDFFEMGDRFCASFEKFVYMESSQNTLIHNDVRLDNMLVGGADGRIIILDWQTVGIGSPMCDVAYLIGTSFSDSAIRKREEKSLFNQYVDTLKTLGGVVDEDRLWKEYRIQSFSGFVQAVCAGMLVERTERGDEMFAVMAERPGQQVLDLDSLELL